MAKRVYRIEAHHAARFALQRLDKFLWLDDWTTVALSNDYNYLVDTVKQLNGVLKYD